MRKLKINIVQYGYLPIPIDYKYIQNFKSSLFEIVNVEQKSLWNTKNGYDYCTYLDSDWKKHIHKNSDCVDLTLVVTNVLLEDNYYARRLSGSLVVFSFAQIFDFLREVHIRLENVILKTLYEYSLIYDELYTSKIWHSDTSGCLFDIDGYLQDVRITFAKPHICDVCKGYLLQNGVAKEKIKCANEELEKLKISWIYRLFEWIEQHPYWSVFLTILYTIIISIFSSFICERLIKNI